MNKLGIIVPYRDREEHLKKFIPHMKLFLDNKLNYKIVIVEQDDKKSFNRAKLLNVGFDFLKEEYQYFCFHDVDLLPIDQNCDYSFTEGVCKLAYAVSQFNFMPRPVDELGGVTLIDKKNFIITNGYNNDYWGWGVEDNDFGLRCKVKNIPFVSRNGRYMSLAHKPNGDTYGDKPSEQTLNNRKLFEKIKNNDQLFNSGLSNLNYKINNLEDKIDFIHLKVSI